VGLFVKKVVRDAFPPLHCKGGQLLHDCELTVSPLRSSPDTVLERRHNTQSRVSYLGALEELQAGGLKGLEVGHNLSDRLDLLEVHLRRDLTQRQRQKEMWQYLIGSLVLGNAAHHHEVADGDRDERNDRSLPQSDARSQYEAAAILTCRARRDTQNIHTCREKKNNKQFK
jgi:hypothetical protein